MPFRDLLKKKEKIEQQPNTAYIDSKPQDALEPPAFKIVRSDTHTQEVIDPPSFPDNEDPPPGSCPAQKSPVPSHGSSKSGEREDKERRRLSDRLHLHRPKSRSASAHSANLPANLPEIQDMGDQEDKEAQWEQRATLLAAANTSPDLTRNESQLSLGSSTGRPRSISDAQSDVNIQEAIRLHEDNRLEDATRMFKQLADQGNVLAEVLFGLSLRHGWGCNKDETRAFKYLSSAASDSAALEAEALKAGLKKGGAAKGELVLAIFELGNCYRYGWGTNVDKPAARQYYETAANLGDTDAMNEAAWCYLEGFGGKKDKFKAAQLLRLAEKNGSKTLGNSWIWKDKYNPT